MTIGDAFFPEGVTLNVWPSIIHSSKEIWGPDAREFNPDRWLQPDAAANEKYFIPVRRRTIKHTLDDICADMKLSVGCRICK